MCGGLTIDKRRVQPGASIKYKTLAGDKIGIWGINRATGAYNARIENLETTWKKEFANRGVIDIEAFKEGAFDISLEEGTGDMGIAILYNEAGEFVVLTQPASEELRRVHHRMPVLVLRDKDWLEDGKLDFAHWEFKLTPAPIPERKDVSWMLK